MKKNNFSSLCILTLLAGIFVWQSCKDELDLQPTGVVSPAIASSSQESIDKLLIGAYASLTGWNTSLNGASAWQTTVTNWAYGDVPSEDAYKGSEQNDQKDLLLIEQFSALSGNPYFNQKWRSLYEGIRRANAIILALQNSGSLLSEADKNSKLGEARAIRGHLYFDAYKMWGNVPYLDETSTDYLVGNDKDILPEIIEDFAFAKANLPATQAQVGRITKYAATAYLGKAYLYQKKYAEAKAEFDEVVASGNYELLSNFYNIYNPATKDNNKEAIFTVRHSVDDGAVGDAHGDYGSVLSYIQGGPGGCCGFFTPSENLANAYKTRNGLPIDDFTGATKFEFNDDAMTGGNMSDFGVESDSAFTLFAGELDPRLDYTVGRRGIPFLDWGIHPGKTWARSPADQGHYTQKKRFISKANREGGFGGAGAWGEQTTAIDYHVIRYADVLLMLAESEVELNNLSRARELVNMVRKRAKDMSYVKDSTGNANAANYNIEEYPSTASAFSSQANARKAVYFERKLEMALEGHRFFDIVRWGIAAEVLAEKRDEEPVAYASKINYTKDKNEKFPIPQAQIDLTQKDGKTTLKQNQGY